MRWRESGLIVINLTRLNGQFMAVNPDLLKFIEASPDTVITLLTGEKVVVSETPDQVISRVLEYKRSVCTSSGLGMSSFYRSSRVIGPENQEGGENI